MREKINFKLEEISLEEIQVQSEENGESKKGVSLTVIHIFILS